MLAHAIRARAWELSLSLEDVARAAGRSRSGVYNVAHAHVSCGIDLLPLLARVLRIELHELLIDVIDLRQR